MILDIILSLNNCNLLVSMTKEYTDSGGLISTGGRPIVFVMSDTSWVLR